MARITERVTVECRAVDAIEILTNRPSDWIIPFFQIASLEGERVAGDVRLSLGLSRPVPGDHIVVVDFDEPEQILGGAVVIPFRWRANGYASLFNEFEGRFVVWSSSPSTTGLTVEGVTDEATGGGSSSASADAVSARAAMAAMQSLVRNLRTAIEESLRTRS